MMKTTRTYFCLLLVLLISVLSLGKEYFPDIEGYQTLICDLHTHTVFSDGTVWPTVRVDEAKRESLDAIAISDHIEYQPHKEDVPTNHNRPYELAFETAQKKNVLLIKAAEITRDTPPGHYNALFLDDINLLDVDAFLGAIKAANDQGAFVFWNHHTWQGVDKGQWTDLQTTMYENKWLHGMEVANGGSYYPQAHQWCLDKNLTMLGNSDIHQPSLNYNYTPNKHRTVTLVFARQRSVESIQEALKAHRTAVWHKNRLVGKEEYLKPIFDRSVSLSDIMMLDGTVSFKLSNKALINLELQKVSGNGPETIKIDSGKVVDVQAKVGEDGKMVPLKYRVNNLLVKPDQGLEVEFTLAKEPILVSQ